jgi:hypothetical protein
MGHATGTLKGSTIVMDDPLPSIVQVATWLSSSSSFVPVATMALPAGLFFDGNTWQLSRLDKDKQETLSSPLEVVNFAPALATASTSKATTKNSSSSVNKYGFRSNKQRKNSNKKAARQTLTVINRLSIK